MIDLDENKVGIDIIEKIKYPDYHGSPYDRGGADSYYRRSYDPHHYGGPQGGPHGGTVKIYMIDMTPEEITAYTAGYRDNEEAGDFKEW